MKKNKKETRKNHSTLNTVCKIIVIAIVFFMLLGFGFLFYIYLDAPEFNTNLLYRQESSNIYDAKGNLIATIGTEKRNIVDNNELPQV